MARKKYGRYRRKRYYRRYKSISYNYFKSRVETVAVAQFPIAQAGDIQYWTEGAQVTARGQAWALSSIFENSPSYLKFRTVFGYMKVLGIKLQFTPVARNYNGAAAMPWEGQVYAGVIYGTAPADVATDAARLASLDNSLMVSMSNASSTYAKARNEEQRWHLANVVPTINIAIASTRNAVQADGPKWNVRIIVYVAFKRSNA